MTIPERERFFVALGLIDEIIGPDYNVPSEVKAACRTLYRYAEGPRTKNTEFTQLPNRDSREKRA